MSMDALISNQRQLAQAIFALAESVDGTTGAKYPPITFAELPSPASAGMLAVISDSTVNTWGTVIAGGGGFTVMAFRNATNWTVFAK